MRPSTALRNEAAAVLAQAELVSSSSEHRLPTGAQRVCFSRTLEWVAQPLPGPARWRVARLDDDSEVAVFPVPTVAGETPVFSRQSRYLAFRSAASETHPSEVFVWDLSQHSTVLRRPAAGTGECSLAPDESAVVFFGPDGGLHWVRLDDPSQSRIVVADGAGWFLRFAPDGRLAVAGRDRMTIVSPASGMGLQTLSPDFAIAAIAWSPDGCWLAIGGVNHEVRLWSPGEPATRLLGTHDGLVHHVEFSPTSEFLVSNGYDGSSRFWEVPSGRLVAFTQEGYAQQFSADGTRLGWFRSRHSYGAWRFLPSPVYRTFRVPAAGKATIDSADLDAHGRWLIGANDAGVWCFSTTNTAAVVAAPLAGARAARWWPGQPAVLVATTTGLVRLAYREEDTSGTFAWVRTEPLPMDGIEDLTDVWVAADGAQALAISQTKAWLVNLGAADRGPRLLDGALAARGRHARLSPDARWAAVSPDYARGTLLFDVTGGAPNRDFHPAALSRAAFSTDGRWFADGSFDAITLYDTARWQPALRLARESASDLPGVAAFAPDGRSLAYTPNLRSIRLVQLPSGTEVLTLTAPDLRMLTDLFFNEDGRLLGALTSEGTVQLWNLAELHIRLGAMDLDWDEPQSH
jgi:WD40 repeat protein